MAKQVKAPTKDAQDQGQGEQAQGSPAPGAPGGQLVVLGKADASGAGEEQHGELRKHVLDLRDQGNRNSWEMAAALLKINREGLYHQWDYSSWRDYVEKELDFLIRKAQQLVKTEEWLCTLPKNIQAWFRTLTYTKARMLTGHVTAENAAEWRVRLEGRTVMEIDEMLHKEAQEAAADPDGKGADAGPERQKPFKAQMSPQQRANLFRALEVLAKISGRDTTEDGYGYLLDLMATEFLATNNVLATVQEYLRGIESVIALKLVAYDEEHEEIVYGEELLDALNLRAAEAAAPEEEAEQDDAEGMAAGAVH